MSLAESWRRRERRIPISSSCPPAGATVFSRRSAAATPRRFCNRCPRRSSPYPRDRVRRGVSNWPANEREMKLPPDIECLTQPRLLIWRPRGVLNEEKINEILVFLAAQENQDGRPFDRFSDLSLLDAVDLTFKYV